MNNDIQLGKEQAYPQEYNPGLLVSIAREENRKHYLDINSPHFVGEDIWTAYELSWLDAYGKPIVRIAEFSFSAASTNIVESKSFKYYLNSLNQTRFDTEDLLLARLEEDLSKVSGGAVKITLCSLNTPLKVNNLSGFCVDDLPVEITDYTPSKTLLVQEESVVVEDELYSHLLKSNCPVTGQPDWATVWIRYSGTKISPESFLRYIVAYRNHQDFHESCVEKIYADIWQQCMPTALVVYARYTRRGGLDINPLRSSIECGTPFGRLLRQ